MARPRAEQPTPAELDLLEGVFLGTPEPERLVRDVSRCCQPVGPGHTPGLHNCHEPVECHDREGALAPLSARPALSVYEPASPRERTLRSLLGETLRGGVRRVGEPARSRICFDHQLMPGAIELDRIRSLHDAYQSGQPAEPEEGGGLCSRSRTRCFAGECRCRLARPARTASGSDSPRPPPSRWHGTNCADALAPVPSRAPTRVPPSGRIRVTLPRGGAAPRRRRGYPKANRFARRRRSLSPVRQETRPVWCLMPRPPRRQRATWQQHESFRAIAAALSPSGGCHADSADHLC